jgi:hypothetical protein
MLTTGFHRQVVLTTVHQGRHDKFNAEQTIKRLTHAVHHIMSEQCAGKHV